MNKLIADTNVIVRLLTGDDAIQSAIAAGLLEKAQTGEFVLLVPDVVVIETCWMLKSIYRFTHAEIASALLRLLSVEEVETEHGPIVDVLRRYQTANIDVIDIYLAYQSKRTGSPVLTWNKRDFSRLECEFYTPDEYASG